MKYSYTFTEGLGCSMTSCAFFQSHKINVNTCLCDVCTYTYIYRYTYICVCVQESSCHSRKRKTKISIGLPILVLLSALLLLRCLTQLPFGCCRCSSPSGLPLKPASSLHPPQLPQPIAPSALVTSLPPELPRHAISSSALGSTANTSLGLIH